MFDTKYTIRRFDKFHDQHSSGYLETYGEEFEFVKSFAKEAPDNIKYIWTVLDIDGKLVIAAGLHYVNRFNYIITIEEWENEFEEYPWCDFLEMAEELNETW
jgi:hypothetical protein